jgi:DNA-binding NtrC family response regulator
MAAILIIDDDAQVRSVLRLMLTRQGHEVEEAENGVQGMAAFQRRPFALVFSDIFMPEKEGLETIREMRKLSPTLKIIAMSGGSGIGNADFLKIAGNLGADHTLHKPFDAQAVQAALLKLLGPSKS